MIPIKGRGFINQGLGYRVVTCSNYSPTGPYVTACENELSLWKIIAHMSRTAKTEVVQTANLDELHDGQFRQSPL